MTKKSFNERLREIEKTVAELAAEVKNGRSAPATVAENGEPDKTETPYCIDEGSN